MVTKRPRSVLFAVLVVALLPGAITQAGAQSKTVNSAMRLEYLMTFHVDLLPPVDVGQTAVGHRQILLTSGGTFEGPKLRGKVLPGPCDWFLQSPHGIGRPDVRGTFQTDDGANIYLRYQGVQVWTQAAGAKFSKGEAIDFGEIYFVVAPLFETGDP